MSALRVAIAALMTAEGRKAWALFLMAGAGMSMTAYATAALFFIRHRAAYIFYLGLSAHFIILVVVTGFAGLIVKRSIVAQFGANRRIEFSDQAEAAAAAVMAAAQTASKDESALHSGDTVEISKESEK